MKRLVHAVRIWREAQFIRDRSGPWLRASSAQIHFILAAASPALQSEQIRSVPLAMHISADHDRIRHFVRRSLGCACPDAVFERIELARDVDAAALQLVIGERLLIRVHVVDRADGLAQRLRRWTADGLRSRDARGLRRLRVVLAATNPEAIEAAARGLFQGMDAAPGDAYLHVLHLRAVAAALGLDAAAAAVAGESTHASTLRRALP